MGIFPFNLIPLENLPIGGGFIPTSQGDHLQGSLIWPIALSTELTIAACTRLRTTRLWKKMEKGATGYGDLRNT